MSVETKMPISELNLIIEFSVKFYSLFHGIDYKIHFFVYFFPCSCSAFAIKRNTKVLFEGKRAIFKI